MSISLAAARVYAKALFDISTEAGGPPHGAAPGASKDAATETGDQLHAVVDAFAGLDPQLRSFFEIPLLRAEAKRAVLDQGLKGKVGRPVLGLLYVLVDKRREQLLGPIVAQYDELLDEHLGRVKASVTSARKLDPALVESLRNALQVKTQRPVVLAQRVDPEVIGGIRVSLGDIVLDGTLRRGLSDMRRTLTASSAN